MTPNRFKFLVLPGLLLFVCNLRLQAQLCDETFADCGDLNFEVGFEGKTVFCEQEDAKIRINVTLGDPDSIYVRWGDNSVTGYKAQNSFTAAHQYDFSRDTCLRNRSSVSVPIFITARKRCGTRISQLCYSTSLRVKVNPLAAFNVDPVLCRGQEVELTNQSCENKDEDDPISYTWTFPDGRTATSIDATFTLPANLIGSQTIRLAAQNACGTGTGSRTVLIRDLPQARADFIAVPGSRCDVTKFRFTNRSTDADRYEWTVAPSNLGHSFVDTTNNRHPSPRIQFVKPGRYTIIQKAINICGEDTTHYNIEVFASPTVALAPEPPACEQLTYTPKATYEGSISSYSWTFEGGTPGTSTAANPTNIRWNQPGSYRVTIQVNGPCGPKSATQTVQILSKDAVQFDLPTEVCKGAGIIPLRATPKGGKWYLNGSNTALRDTLLDVSNLPAGTLNLRYEVGTASCKTEANAIILLKTSAEVNLGPAASYCIDQLPITLDFSPKGGVWRGSTGITDAALGVFNPALAGAGQFDLIYQFTDPATNCTVEKTQSVTVVALPSLTLNRDTVNICLDAADVSLPQLSGLDAGPAGGTFTWSGSPGITNASQGAFNGQRAGGAGLYPLSVEYRIPPGCSTSFPLWVRVADKTPADAGKDTTVCLSAQPLILQGFPGGGQWSGNPAIDSRTGSVNLQTAGPGTHIFTYSVSPGTSCASTDEIRVIIVAAQSVNAGDDQFVCSTTTALQLPQGLPANGFWSGPTLNNGNLINPQQLGAGVYRYAYTARDLPAACATDSITVQVDNPPVSGFTTEASACTNTAIVLDLPSQNNNNRLRYSWQTSDGRTFSGLNPDIRFSQPGQYSLSLKVELLHPVSNQSLCESGSSQNIRIVSPPQRVSFDKSASQGCADLSVTLTNTSLGEDLHFRWNFGNGRTDTISQPGAIVFSGGTKDTTYIVVLTTENFCGDSRFADSITVFPKPIADFGISYTGNLCSGAPLTFSNVSTGNPDRYEWYFSDGRFFNTPNLPELRFFTDSIPRDYQLTLIAFNECGMDTLDQIISVHPTNVMAFISLADSVLCTGDTLKARSFSTPGAPVYWKIEDNRIAGPDIHYPLAKTGLTRLTLFAEGCGFDSTDVWVRTHPLPELSLEAPPGVCQKEAAAFRLITNGQSHVLYFGDGDSTKALQSMHVYSAAGRFTITASAFSAQGCLSKISNDIEIFAQPQAIILQTDSVCAGAPALWESQSDQTVKCTWVLGDGNRLEGCNISHIYSEGGLYSAELITTSNLGCRDTASAVRYIRERPVPDFAYQILEPCTPGEVVFSDSSINANSIFWNLGDGAENNRTSFTHFYNTAGSFQVSLTASNAHCDSTISKTITIDPVPVFDFELLPRCTEQAGVDLKINTIASNLVTVSNGTYRKKGTYHAMLQPGVYLVEVIDSITGCMTRQSVEIREPQVAFVDILANGKPVKDTLKINLGENVLLEAITNKADASFRWFPSEGLSVADIAKVIAAPCGDITYFVEVPYGVGCTALDSIHIKVDTRKAVVLPNAFTPDGDGNNDIFYLRTGFPEAVQAVLIFQIYDRWGTLVFEQRDFQPEDPAFGWDGFFKGKRVQPSVLRYYAEVLYKCQVQPEILNGTVKILY